MIRQKLKKTLTFAAAAACMLFGLSVAEGGPAFAAEAPKAAPVFQFAENGGGAYTDVYQHVAHTNDGGFVVGGYSMGASESPAWDYLQTAHQNNHGVLVKYDKDRNIQWSRSFGETRGVVVFNDMDVLKDGRIAVIGRKSAASGVDQNAIEGVSWYILLVDPQDPNKYTEYYIGGTSGDQGYGITALPDGGFAVTGWVASKAGYWTCREVSGEQAGDWSEPGQLWQPENGTIEDMPKRTKYRDTVVVKFASDREIAWNIVNNVGVMGGLAVEGASASETTESITSDAKGDIVVSGSGQLAKNITNAEIVKLDGRSGDILWQRSAGRANVEAAPEDKADYINAVYTNVTALTDGSYVATGEANQDADTEEAWKTTSQKDYIIIHYDSDGSLIHTESFGRAGDKDSRPEGVTATADGGYIINGSQSGVMYEDDLIHKGYNWGSYGAQDAVLIKYDKNDELEWAENYGTVNGDWFNAVAAGDDGQLIVVGETNGKRGVPSWENNGGYDGIVLISDGTSEGTSGSSGIVADGKTVWADGTYEGRGTGYGVVDATAKNDGLMTMEVTIEDHRIASVQCTSNLETPAYYKSVVRKLFPKFVENQTASVDTVSGATLTSNGAIEGVSRALGKASAKAVDQQIDAIETADGDAAREAAVREAAAAYGELGTYALEALENEDALREAAQAYGITLQAKSDAALIPEVQPEPAGELPYNDRYYKLQDIYYGNINAEGLRSHGYTGEGVTIAVMDSGITGAHADLDYTKILDGWDYGDGKTFDAESAPGREMKADELYDNNGHGTAVAGILQALTDNEAGISGLLSDATIVPLRVMPATGNNAQAKTNSSRQVASAIMDAVDKYHVDVITTSLDVIDTEELQAAVAHAAENNVIIVGAAGNSGTADGDGSDAYIYPAAYEEVISVGAVDKNNMVRDNSQKNDQVFVTAPGENVVLLDISRNTRCTISSGTSYSSPIVAAMAAAAKQRMQTLSGDKTALTVDQFKSALRESSMDAGESGYDTSYGYGIVDLEAFAQRLDDGTDMADAAVEIVSSDLTDLQEQLEEANAAVQEAQAAIDSLGEDASEEEIAAVTETLTEAQNKVAELQEIISKKESMLNEALKAAYPTIAEEIENLEHEVTDLTQQLAEARMIDITYYAATLDAESYEYTGSAIEPAVTVPGLDAAKGDYTVSYADNTEIGTATVTITGNEANNFKGTITKTFEITKIANPITVKGKTIKLKAKKVGKKARTVKPLTVSGAKTKVTYKGTGLNKKSKKALKINKKTGKITVKKKTKKGTYKMKVTVTAAGNATYATGSKTITVTIKVR